MRINKFSKLKNKLQLFVILNIIFIVIALSAYLGINYYKNLIENNKLAIKSDILTTKKRLADLKTQLSEVEDARKFWEKSEDLNNAHNGLQLDDAYSIIKHFQEKYNILNLQIHLSSPIDLGKEYHSSSAMIVSSEVTLSFGAMSDENAFQFVDALLNNFPGFKLVKSFKITKKVEFSQELLRQVRSGNKPSVVVGELLFEWRDFKDI